MNTPATLLSRVYALSLKLYPRTFRAEYEEELCTVFDLVAESAAQAGTLGLAKIAWRELRDLPISIVAAYVRERRRFQMQNRLNRWFNHQPGSWQEILLATLPFLLLMGFPGILTVASLDKTIPAVLGLGLLGLIFLVLASLGIIGLLVKLPRWAMPYAGMPLALTAFVAMFILNTPDTFFGSMSAPWAARMLGFLAVFLGVLFVITALCIWLSQKLALTHPFYERLQEDWSLLSFAMYGGTLVFVFGMYEDIEGAGWYVILTLIPLILGIWAYLGDRRTGRRLFALLLSITVAMGIALVANLQLMDWVSPAALRIGSLSLNRVTMSVILSWFTCGVMILAPAVLQFTFPTGKLIPAES
jgi:hypothetical protein